MLSELGLFVAAFGASAVLPGPDTMLLFSRALNSGARAAVTVALGLTLGKLALLSAAIAGVTTAAAALGPAFWAIKVAGGAYLIWLGVRMWRRAGSRLKSANVEPESRLSQVRDGWRGVGLGALLTLSNPQALLFYVSVLPAVLGQHEVGLIEYMSLCTALCVVMAAVSCIYILAATHARSALRGGRQAFAERAGAVLIGVVGVVVVIR